jgi:hypothetical protein
MNFEPFPKIPRLSRECVITEKIDGTNGQILIELADVATQEDEQRIEYVVWAGSRNRWLTEKEDNHGFYKWVDANKEQLCLELGIGRHYGEWWGTGINKRYPGAPKTFSLFNVDRWQEPKEQGLLTLCQVVPILSRCEFNTKAIEDEVLWLASHGSVAWPECKDPEGVVVFHYGSHGLFKKTCKGDEKGKEQA